jgi:peptide methionine sulfoxide reductase MsrA
MQAVGRRVVLCHERNCYHQQYLYKVPNGYCGIGGTGATCPIGLATAD